MIDRINQVVAKPYVLFSGIPFLWVFNLSPAEINIKSNSNNTVEFSLWLERSFSLGWGHGSEVVVPTYCTITSCGRLCCWWE